MSVILPTLAASFAAFCIWLTVRTINRRERWSRRTLAALLVGLPLVYVASFGPAVRLTDLDDPWAPLAAAVFWPLGRAAVDGPELIRDPLVWYVGLFADPCPRFAGWPVYCLPVGPEGKWSITLSELD